MQSWNFLATGEGDAGIERSILCVENESATRELLEEALRGYSLVFARTAFEALRSLHAQVFDAYVLDYWLAGWSGVQLCREVRSVDPRGPVVFCSGATREIDQKRALRAGANAYLCKPIDPQVLRKRIEVLLTVSDMDSLAAKPHAHDTLENELEEYARKLIALGKEGQLSASFLEQTARPVAFRAFAAKGGTRAHFSRWWPQMFASALQQKPVLQAAPATPAVETTPAAGAAPAAPAARRSA